MQVGGKRDGRSVKKGIGVQQKNSTINKVSFTAEAVSAILFVVMEALVV